MNNKGFALTELVVVLVLLAIVTTIATINFNDWQRKAQIERQTRELFADINKARTDAITSKLTHRIVFQPNSYSFKRYSSADEPYTAGTELFSKNVAYQLSLENGNSIADYSVEFNMRGFTTGTGFSASKLALRLNPVGTAAGFDCIVIHDVRTNMGKIENGECTAK